MSYNPDFDEHQELLLKAHLIEVRKLKEEQRDMRRLTICAKRMSWDAIEASCFISFFYSSNISNSKIRLKKQNKKNKKNLN